jgi:GMP synthase (glutamine-hydrolysing)
MFSRRSAVALRHVAFEDLGLLAPIMEREGWNVSFCEAAVDDLGHRSIRNADLVIVLGGPIGVYETDDYPFLTSELALIEYRLSRDLPTLLRDLPQPKVKA